MSISSFKNLSVESYLRKKKERPILKNKTTQRFFKFDLKEKTFSYKDVKENPEIKVIHIGRDLKGFYDTVDVQDQNLWIGSFGFKIITTNKTYVLFAEFEDVYVKWIKILNMAFNSTNPVIERSSFSNINFIKTPSKIIVTNKLDFKDDFEEDDLNLIRNIEKENNNNKSNNGKNNNIIEIISSSNNTQNILINSVNEEKIKSDNENENNNKIHNSTLFKSNNQADRSHSHKPEASDPRPSGKMITEFVLNNMQKKKMFNEEELVRKYTPLHKKKHEIATKLIISGINDTIDNEFDEVNDFYNKDDNLNSEHRDSPENIGSRVKKSNKINMVKPLPSPIPIKTNPFFNQLEESDNEEAIVTSMINPIILPNSANYQYQKIPFHSKNKNHLKNSKDNENKSELKLELNAKPKSSNNIISDSSNISNVNPEEKIEWRELNDDWGLMRNPRNTVYNLLNKNANENLTLQAKEKPKVKLEQSLFDETNQHIKKSKPSKRISIENLHYCNQEDNNKNINNNNSNIDGKVYSKSQISSPRPRGTRIRSSILNVVDEQIWLDVSKMIRQDDEEEVSVKRQVVGTGDDKHNPKSFVMNLVIPEKLAKFGNGSSNDRIKLITEQLLNPNLEHTVYTGRHKVNPNDSSSIINVTNITNHIELKLYNNEMNENFNNQTVADMILKVPYKKNYNQDVKKTISITGSVMRENMAHDEFHTKIVNTVKIESITHLGDDFHIPVATVKELTKKEGVKNLEKVNFNNNQEIGQNGQKNINNKFEEIENYIEGINNISNISNYYSKLNIDEVWDTSIIYDD